MNEAGARNIDFRKIIGGFKQRNVESAGEAASKGALVAARIAGGDCEGMKFSVMPHAKRDDRRIEATGNPSEDRGELRGPRRAAIEDNLPKGNEGGSLMIDAGPRGQNDRRSEDRRDGKEVEMTGITRVSTD